MDCHQSYSSTCEIYVSRLHGDFLTNLDRVVCRLKYVALYPSYAVCPLLVRTTWCAAPADTNNLSSKPYGGLANVSANETVSAKNDHLCSGRSEAGWV